MDKVIEVKDLTFGYDKRIVLENVSFSVKRGDFLGIMGPNGSGKSTLVKLVLGLIAPLKGEIKILGESIESFNRWDKIGYISQKANAFNTSFPATVEEVVGANLYSRIGLFKPFRKRHKELVYEALELVGMQDYAGKLIGDLSGGQQQRVFIARVLVSRPEIMFLDEPTVGVDARSEEAVYCLLARLNKELGITVVIVTHDISAVTVHANKLVCMGSDGLSMHDLGAELPEDVVSRLYGHGFSPHFHRHDCNG